MKGMVRNKFGWESTKRSFFMKFLVCALFAGALLFASGCVQGTVSKQISVYRDAQGNITQTVETETFSHAGTIPQGLKVDHLRYGGGNTGVLKVSTP